LVFKHILNGLEGVKVGKYFWGCKKDFFIKKNYPVISTTFWEEKSPRKADGSVLWGFLLLRRTNDNW
jgi:hypothetical protein